MSGAVTAQAGLGRTAGLRFASDDRLVRMAAEGDSAAFAAIYRRYHQDLDRYCQGIVGSPELAEDALQNTIVSAMKSLPGETRTIALKPWLYRVAHNESISLLRQRKPTEELDPKIVEVDSDPGRQAQTREGLRSLLSDLETLPERQRGALVMRELGDLSYAEIAASFEFSEGAARQAIYEAREALLAMAEGREMSCATVRAEISADDRRVLRGRKLRAHLRDCLGCSGFEEAIKDRRAQFAQITPLAPAAAAGILQSVLGSSAAGGGTGALGGLGGTGALGGAGAVGGLGGGTALKTAVAVVAVAATGVGSADVTGVIDLGGSGTSAESAAPASAEKAASHGGQASDEADRGSGGTGPGNGSGANADGGKGGGGEGHAGGAGKPGKDQGQGNGNAHGGQGQGPGAGSSGTPSGETQTPPGQAQTPPGQAHTPPGQAHTPPGQAHTPPGQAQTPPGQSGPSNAATQNPNGPPPGQVQTPPGQAQTPPGQADASGSGGVGAQGTMPPGQQKPKLVAVVTP